MIKKRPRLRGRFFLLKEGISEMVLLRIEKSVYVARSQKLTKKIK